MKRVREKQANRAQTWFQKVVTWPLFPSVAVFVVFWIAAIGIYGPAYLSDEIGYLTKASTIAGSVVHLPSSWFGGYSLLISPAFLISHNPFVEWQIILVLNALMWAITAWLLRYSIIKLKPSLSARMVQYVTLGAMAYPAWVSMSGYAFSTTGFVLCFMGIIAALLKSELTKPRWVLIAALLTGYLCWIHPMGFVFLGVFAVALVGYGIMKRQWWPVLASAVAIAMGVLYPLIIGPWFDMVMASGGVNNNHYAVAGQDLVSSVKTWTFWALLPTHFIGLLFSVVVSSFGLIVYAVIPTVRQLTTRTGWRAFAKKTDPAVFVTIVVAVTIVAAAALVAVTNSATSVIRPDQWVYERYTDGFLLPLLALGLASTWTKKWSWWVAGAVLVTGIVIYCFIAPANTNFVFINKVNLQAFWPVVLNPVLKFQHYFWAWGVIAAIGIAFIGLFGERHRRWLLLLLVPVVVMFGANYYYHRGLLDSSSHVDPVVYNGITKHYAPGVCVGFTEGADTDERYELYSFYLHNDTLQQMTLQQWLMSNCVGPYLTYTLPYSPQAVVAATTEDGLMVVVRRGDTAALQAF